MTLALNYQDVATFVRVESDGYRGTKVPLQQVDVPVIFEQNTGMQNAANQEAVNADAVLWASISHAFIAENEHRLEGMYVLIREYGGVAAESWFKITSVTTYRDHLLGNTVDNIQCALKKTEPIPTVS